MLYDEYGIYRGDILSDGKNKSSISHYGTPRHSGRYPWGSGDNPYQRNADFLGQIEKLRKQGVSEKAIADSMGINTSELRKRKSLARAENRAYLSAEAKRLKEKGMSTSAIARRMEMNESSVRLLLDEEVSDRMTSTARNAKLLKDRVDQYKYIDVGKGSEEYLGISSTSMGNALKMLEKEGYTIHEIPVEQLGNGKITKVKVVAGPGVEWREVMKNKAEIKTVTDLYSEDGGQTLRKIERPVSIDSKRIDICYAEDGGDLKDGVIELRRGVDDISLGNARYAQVRIMVDNSHYLKGMAVYSDDLPPGVDIRFNTNKHKGTPMMDSDPDAKQVLKPIKSDPDNPFGANIKDESKLIRAQRHYIDKDGVERQSALNIVSEEGTWYDWNRTLASQFLSKQPPELARQQLKLTRDIANDEFKELMTCENPTVKAKLLEDFAGRCDHDAVHLAAAALPRQSTRVILPLIDGKDNEIYAPGYQDGEQVALVRYPHASVREIPILTVNNQNPKAKAMIGEAIDAVGIPHKAAEQLSGADFDGDTVLVLPTRNVKIKNGPQFKELQNFDTKSSYPEYPGMHRMTKQEHGLEMGKVSNLITDMTIMGAPDDEIVRAVKHSMVIVDAEKHHLDYKRSELENRIPELKERYQGSKNGGASTFLSRSTSPYRVGERKEKAPSKMSPEEKERWKEGEVIWEYSHRTQGKAKNPSLRLMTEQERKDWDSKDPKKRAAVKRAFYNDGRMQYKDMEVTNEVNKGAEFDPYSLVSTGSRETTRKIERVYADHATELKALAKKARKEARATVDISYNPEMNKKYKREVESLDHKLSVARKNAPLERQAQIIANVKWATVKYNNPEMDDEHQKKEKARLLDAARKSIGAKKLIIGSNENPLTEKEWEAIQAGAISKTKLKAILDNSDMSVVKKYAFPHTREGISSAKLSRARQMLERGYSRQDVCDQLDISESTLISAIGVKNF